MESEFIKKTIEEFLKNMGVSFEEIVFVSPGKLGKPTFVIKSKESGLLIGTDGAHFGALNHLIRKITARRGEEVTKSFFIDVNDYQERLVESLKNKASMLAERARSFKTSIEMEPMSSYERMVVHTFLENTPDIITESSGEGEERRVILKYIEPETQKENFL